jgi:hyperosmotically inducible protein
LLADETASSVDVEVEVNRGVVSLGGYVNSKAERDAALRVAGKVSNVKEVIDNMTIR